MCVRSKAQACIPHQQAPGAGPNTPTAPAHNSSSSEGIEWFSPYPVGQTPGIHARCVYVFFMCLYACLRAFPFNLSCVSLVCVTRGLFVPKPRLFAHVQLVGEAKCVSVERRDQTTNMKDQKIHTPPPFQETVVSRLPVFTPPVCKRRWESRCSTQAHFQGLDPSSASCFISLCHTQSAHVHTPQTRT